MKRSATTFAAVAVAGLLMATAALGKAESGWIVHPGVTVPVGPNGQLRVAPVAPKIRHVVFLIQENRSFDNLFHGFPGADTATSGLTSGGQQVTLQPVSLKAPFDLLHDFKDAVIDMDGGKMDGFDHEGTGCQPKCPPYPAYSYVPQSETSIYFAMARQYVLADRFFASDEDGSFVSHQYLISGQAKNTYGLPGTTPWGCDGTGVMQLLDPSTIPGTPTSNTISDCFDPYPTLADDVDRLHLTWRFYSAPPSNLGYLWSAYDEVKHIREGPEWAANVVPDNNQFLGDVAAGTLANVTWITPRVGQSDHPASRSTTGPLWVKGVVNAIGESQFWNSTAIFLLWDDWGGWYDHAPPPIVDFDGLGVRVPLIVISPYSRRGVAHTTYEFGSLLSFVEQNFGMPPLAHSDSRANPLGGGDVFDFNQPPRAYVPF